MKLLYIVDEYPYAVGEHFPDLECRYLAKIFSEVLLVPMRSPEKWTKPLYELPPNVSPRTDVARWMHQSLKTPGQVRKLLTPSSGLELLTETVRMGGKGRSRIVDFFSEALLFFKALKNFVPLDHYDVFYTFWLGPPSYALGKIKKTLPDRLFVSRAHGYDLYADRSDHGDLPFQKKVIRSLDRVFPCSEHGSSYLRERFPSLSDRIAPSHLGIELHSQTSRPSTDGVLRIVSCSNLIPLKRVDLIVEILRRVERRVSWIHFGDGPERSTIEKKLRSLPSRVRAELRGFVSNPSLLSHYAKEPVDLFLHVSAREGIPVSLMEAMSFGIPCCATNAGGTAELVHSSNGYLLDLHPPPEMIAQIVDRHPIESHELRLQAQRTIKENFSAERNFTRFAENLVLLAKQKRGA